VESPENWFEDFGTGVLKDGEARIDFEEVFSETVNRDLNYHVFLTPIGDSPAILFVSEKDPKGFTVRGVGMDGKPIDIKFDYRVTAKRLGFETLRLDETSPPPSVIDPKIGVPMQDVRTAAPTVEGTSK
jgi:hypothetical protein